MTEEIWKVFPEKPNYHISNLGNVKNITTGRLRKLSVDKDGFVRLMLTAKSKSHAIHVLVAKLFIDNPKDKKNVGHINKNKADNRVENLFWATQSEQNIQKDIGKTNLNSSGKIVLQYDLRGNFIEEFPSASEAARSLNSKTGASSISKCCLNKKPHYKNFIWKYKPYEEFEGEEWKEVYIDEFKFIVSSFGRIKAKNGRISFGGDTSGGYYRAETKITIKNDNGYEEKPKKAAIHKLVALAFVENERKHDPAVNKVNHKDGNKLNNRAENLEWVSDSDNARHSHDVLGKGHQKKVVQIDKDTGEIINTFKSMATAAACTNASADGISSVVRGRSKTAGGFIWKYAE